jgi:hypothetical protein
MTAAASGAPANRERILGAPGTTVPGRTNGPAREAECPGLLVAVWEYSEGTGAVLAATSKAVTEAGLVHRAGGRAALLANARLRPFTASERPVGGEMS